eukprot:1122453-Rhodomonas_salina.4
MTHGQKFPKLFFAKSLSRWEYSSTAQQSLTHSTTKTAHSVPGPYPPTLHQGLPMLRPRYKMYQAAVHDGQGAQGQGQSLSHSASQTPSLPPPLPLTTAQHPNIHNGHPYSRGAEGQGA